MSGSFTDRLDLLICYHYSTRRMSGRSLLRYPGEDEVDLYISNDIEGPPPIEEFSENYLLTSFDRLRREYITRPIPVYVEPQPVSGEIEWK